MDKEKFVNELIGNSAWTEDDSKFLMGLEENQLEKMAPVKNESESDGSPAPEKTEDVKPKVLDVKEVKDAPAANENQNITPQEFLANAPDDIREVLQDAMVTHASKKEQLIFQITANKKNTFTKDQLSSMNINELVAIAALAVNEDEKKSQPSGSNYFGAGAPVFGGNSEAEGDNEPLEAPVMNFDKDK